jgi:DNA-binding MltR family transcriptional regulator
MAKRQPVPTIAELSAERTDRFFEDLQKETDRGTALLAAAFLEDVLEASLRAYFVDDKGEADKLLVGDSPLGCLSARARLAYCLGLLGPDEYRDLNLVREIRNAFAHAARLVSFEDPGVKDQCRELRIPAMLLEHTKHPGTLAEARSRFVTCVTLLSQFLLARARALEHATPGKDRTVAAAASVDMGAPDAPEGTTPEP